MRCALPRRRGDDDFDADAVSNLRRHPQPTGRTMCHRLKSVCVAGATLAVVAAGVLPQLQAQSPPAPLPVTAAFEVVSVKRMTDPSAQIGARQMGGGRFFAVFTVRTLVQLAFGYPIR